MTAICSKHPQTLRTRGSSFGECGECFQENLEGLQRYLKEWNDKYLVIGEFTSAR